MAERFLSVIVKPCTSANLPHLRYEVIYRDGTPGGWCAGRAPMHMHPDAYAQLKEARERYWRRAERHGDRLS